MNAEGNPQLHTAPSAKAVVKIPDGNLAWVLEMVTVKHLLDIPDLGD